MKNSLKNSNNQKINFFMSLETSEYVEVPKVVKIEK